MYVLAKTHPPQRVLIGLLSKIQKVQGAMGIITSLYLHEQVKGS